MLREIKTKTEHYFVDEYSLKQGEYIDCWSNGRVCVHGFFVNGKIHGEYKSYHGNGQLWVHSFFLNGNRHGEYYRYDQNGNLIRSTFFYHNTDLKAAPSTLTEKDKTYILLSGRLPPHD